MAFAALSIALINCQAESTSQAFETTSFAGKIFPEEPNRALGELQGIYARETLPAEQFPEGNWGVSTNGTRMSIRICSTTLTSKTNLTLGQPVYVAILVRNDGEDPVNLVRAAWFNYPFIFSMKRDGEEVSPLIPPLKPGGRDGSVGRNRIVPGTQHREVLRLDKIYDLSIPGEYEVSAEWRQRSWSVKSGVARFTLADEEASPGSKPQSELPDLKDGD